MESESSHTDTKYQPIDVDAIDDILELNVNTEETVDSEKNTEENDIVYKLIVKCKEEMENNCLYKPLEDYIERVAHYTGMSKTKISQIAHLGKIDYDNKYFELNHRTDIFKCVADTYVMKKNPTHRNIYTMCNGVNKLMNFYQFQYMMNILGYEYRKNELGQEILIEDPDLTFERYHYLKQVFKFRRKGAPIYYIDEIFVDKTFTLPKPWIKNIDISSEACDGYVFFHAVSNRGCVNGFFCSPTSKDDFVKWILHILLPNLQESSIIVMDKNDLHRSKTNFITKYHSKEEMLKYLRLNHIPCNENLDKAQLYLLITKCIVKNESYNIANILKSYGHHVLWLPSNFHDLSMTHFLWKYIIESKTIELQNTELREIKIRLFEGLMNLDQIIWKTLDESLYMLEKRIFDIDSKTSQALESNYTFSDNML